MYSIVLVAAMTAAPETPEFCGLLRACFQAPASCSGCGGCFGGGHHHRYSSCSGSCYGGCYGSCHGWRPTFACTGCTGCTGYSIPYTSCSGYGAYPTYGCTGCTGVPYSSFYSEVPVFPSVTDVPQAMNVVPSNKAQIVVKLPADAKLYADERETTLTGSQRTFQTPEIAAGRDFAYTLKVVYGNETEPVTKQVVVRAGHVTAIDFTQPKEESATSAVTVKLPENAKLFVDDVATGVDGGTHSYRTPSLPKGKPFAYQFRAEVVKDGKKDVQTQRIVFQAGEAINVDFTDMSAVRTASIK